MVLDKPVRTKVSVGDKDIDGNEEGTSERSVTKGLVGAIIGRKDRAVGEGDGTKVAG